MEFAQSGDIGYMRTYADGAWFPGFLFGVASALLLRGLRSEALAFGGACGLLSLVSFLFSFLQVAVLASAWSAWERVRRWLDHFD